MVLPKSMRIRGYKCFDYIHKSAKKFNSNLMLLKVTKANENLITEFAKGSSTQSCRCALSISNKVSKKAVVRNKIRRTLHTHLKRRLENRKEHKQKWILLSLKPSSINLSLLDMQLECDKLLSRAGLFYD